MSEQNPPTENKKTSEGLVIYEHLENQIDIIKLGASTEKVVTLTVARMQSLREAVAKARQGRPTGLIIAGPHADMFTAGADLNLIKGVSSQIEAVKLAKEGQSLFAEIEALPFPVIAAISGPCVGGGCELVLACKQRIISDEKSSQIGLPEVQLGILPGFGGTQRLPRLIGLPRALDIILAGKVIKPKQALEAGLVDEVVPSASLIERAIYLIKNASKAKSKKLKLTDRLLTYTKIGRSIAQKKAAQSLSKGGNRFYPAPPAALASVLKGLSEASPEVGYEFEAQELGRLLVTPESKALVRIYFLRENSKALGKSARKTVQNMPALVVGAGAMGAGIAGVLARNDHSVILKDTADAALQRGVDQIKKYVAKQRGLSEQDKSFVINRIEATVKESSNTSSAQIIIEAIVENLEVKKRVLSGLAEQVSNDAIVATNTSSLSVTKIAEGIEHPERVVGMHFFNPVEKMPLVEIVRAAKTSDRTLAVIASLAVQLGKFPIIVSDVPGFLVNRILSPYLNEAAFLLAEGYRIQDIDRAATNFGMPMGPLRLLDEVGLDVASHVSDIMVAGYGDRMKSPGFEKLLYKANRLGRKSGKGFYVFNGDEITADDRAVREVLNIKEEKRPAANSDGGLNEIQERLIFALINEAIWCLDEGVAGAAGPEAASQIDLGSVMGFGFPPFRGGILYYTQNYGLKNAFDTLTKLQKICGQRFKPVPGIKARIDSKKPLV